MPATRHCCYGSSRARLNLGLLPTHPIIIVGELQFWSYCYGRCKSDSRYAHRDDMQGVWWIPFPKPHLEREKCEVWVRKCGRKNFSSTNVNKWTYICSKHFVGENGPTEANPHPISTMMTESEVQKLSKKRKPPRPRQSVVESKEQKLEAAEGLLDLWDSACGLGNPATDLTEAEVRPCERPTLQKCDTEPQTDRIFTNSSAQTEVNNVDCQTQTYAACSENVATAVQQKLLTPKEDNCAIEKTEPAFSFESTKDDEKQFFFYTGLYVSQFLHLYKSLGSSVNCITYWRGKRTVRNKESDRCSTKSTKLSPLNQLFLTLIRLRLGLLTQDLAYRFRLSKSTVSTIVCTWIQLLFNQFGAIRENMFPSREILHSSAPSCFKPFPNTRIILDCFEVFVHIPRNFEEQGNMYSSYKHHATFKVLVGIAPNGAIIFVSDAFEGCISDKDIVLQSKLLDKLNSGDLVIADRGFTIYDLLMERKVDLNIPPFLKGREKLTPQEEVKTKQIARIRIHVERAIERMRKFKILNRVLPLSMKATASQIVFVVGCLVNYQKPLVD